MQTIDTFKWLVWMGVGVCLWAGEKSNEFQFDELLSICRWDGSKFILSTWARTDYDTLKIAVGGLTQKCRNEENRKYCEIWLGTYPQRASYEYLVRQNRWKRHRWFVAEGDEIECKNAQGDQEKAKSTGGEVLSLLSYQAKCKRLDDKWHVSVFGLIRKSLEGQRVVYVGVGKNPISRCGPTNSKGDFSCVQRLKPRTRKSAKLQLHIGAELRGTPEGRVYKLFAPDAKLFCPAS